MEQLWNGFCFTAGAAIGGFLVGLILTFRKDPNVKVNDLLRERNEIGRDQAASLQRIARAIEIRDTEARPTLNDEVHEALQRRLRANTDTRKDGAT